MPAELIEPVDTFEELNDMARRIGVSKEAYLIRLNELHRINQTDFKQYMSLIRELNRNLKAKVKTAKDGFAIPPATLSRSYRGDKFFDFVVTNYDNQRISPSVVRDLLDMKVVGLGRSSK
jgi:hypothetical protein